MTKEEALKKLADIIFYAAKSGYMPYDTNDELCAMSIAKKHIDDFYTSLPSDLDEAAEEYAWKKEEPLADGERLSCAFNPRIDAFKAGAEWMAGQGVSMLGKIGIYGVDVESITEKLRKAGFKLGEEVVIQIRKKQ